MPTVIPITGAATLLRASLDHAAEQTTAVADRVASGDNFAAALSDVVDAKLTFQATAFVAHTLDELAGNLLSLPRR